MLIFPDLFSYLLVFHGSHQAVFYRRRANDDQSEACILQADLGWLGCSLDLNLLDVFPEFIPIHHLVSQNAWFYYVSLIIFILWPSIANQLPHCDSLAQWNEHTNSCGNPISNILKLRENCPSIGAAFLWFSLYKSITEDQQRTQWRPCCWLLGSTFEMGWAS